MEQPELVTATAVVIQSTSLSLAERAELAQYEATFKRAFYEAGCSLRAIHEKRLYREHGSFEEYCESRLNIQRRHGYRLLEAAEVVRILEDVSDRTHPLPTNLEQTRPLAPLRDDPEILRDTWERAHEIAEEEGRPLTARHVSAAVEEYQAGAPAPVSRFNEGMRSSDNKEWYTPAPIIEVARAMLGGIDLDPASSAAAQETVQAARWFGLDHPRTADRDGLDHEWSGRVWMNPPYGDVIGDWVARLVHQYDMDITTEALALLPARLDTAWWQDNLGRFPFCVLRGRLRFSGAPDSAPFPSVVVYLGTAPGVFAHHFGPLGLIYRPA